MTLLSLRKHTDWICSDCEIDVTGIDSAGQLAVSRRAVLGFLGVLRTWLLAVVAATLAANCWRDNGAAVLPQLCTKSRDGARGRLGGSSRHLRLVEIPVRGHLSGGCMLVLRAMAAAVAGASHGHCCRAPVECKLLYE